MSRISAMELRNIESYHKGRSKELLEDLFPSAFLKVAVVGKGEYFVPYREALVEAIEEFGFEARGFDGFNYEYCPDVFLVINPIQYMEEKLFKNDFIYAGIQTEQISNNEVYCINMGRRNYERLKPCLSTYDFIFEWSPAAFRYLHQKHKNVHFFPHCNFRSMQYHEKYENIKESYEIFFTGWATGIDNRRANLLNLLSKNFNMYPKYENLWGGEKEKAISASKICLNIHFDSGLVFESPRIYEYIANKRFVLTEKISDSYPFVEGEDYESFYIHNVLEKVDYYLSNNEARERIALNGYNKINKHMLTDNIHIILERLLLEKSYRKTNRLSKRSIILQKLGLGVKKW